MRRSLLNVGHGGEGAKECHRSEHTCVSEGNQLRGANGRVKRANHSVDCIGDWQGDPVLPNGTPSTSAPPFARSGEPSAGMDVGDPAGPTPSAGDAMDASSSPPRQEEGRAPVAGNSTSAEKHVTAGDAPSADDTGAPAGEGATRGNTLISRARLHNETPAVTAYDCRSFC